MSILIDFIFNMDKYLSIIVENYGYLVYGILFVVIFCETGLVITPFLPGDSIIFACGAFAAIGKVNIFALLVILALAAVLGDAANYFLGKNYGIALLKRIGGRFVKKKHIEDTRHFYDKYGGLAIFLARFIPIVRTFVPFVAGMSKMNYKKFGLYNIIGGITWVTSFLLIGFYFGNIPLVKQNFSIVILAIIFISVLPVFIRYLITKNKKMEEENCR